MKPDPDARCEECVSRRKFLAQSAMAAAAVAIAAGCGNGQIGPTAVNPQGSGNGGSNSNAIVVANYPALANVGTLVQISNWQAVKRTGATTFVAYSMVCTHQGCLTWLNNNTFSCPCHGAQFDSNGRVTRGPASRSLSTIATSYDATTDQLTIG